MAAISCRITCNVGGVLQLPSPAAERADGAQMDQVGRKDVDTSVRAVTDGDRAIGQHSDPLFRKGERRWIVIFDCVDAFDGHGADIVGRHDTDRVHLRE